MWLFVWFWCNRSSGHCSDSQEKLYWIGLESWVKFNPRFRFSSWTKNKSRMSIPHPCAHQLLDLYVACTMNHAHSSLIFIVHQLDLTQVLNLIQLHEFGPMCFWNDSSRFSDHVSTYNPWFKAIYILLFIVLFWYIKFAPK